MSVAGSLAAAWRILFLTAGAPVIGAVLLAAIGRVTGASWQAAMPSPIAPRLLIAGAALIGIAQMATPLPPHLALWMSPLFVGVRAVVATGLLAFAGARLRGGATVTEAAIVLALYAALVTPIATDWLLGHVPGHAVSSAGMMLFVEQIAGACALTLATGRGEARFRADMGKLMVAAALGLGYLAFMDYLIIWFGNLPAKIGFYAERDGAAGGALVWAALLLGLAAPIALLATGRQRLAGTAVLAALLAFNMWWIGGGPLALVLVVALAVAGWLGVAALVRWRGGRSAHG
ncbi:hypothetical protein [Sphingomonas profundi]|uniref:hypothetical protein n=1 Tax=Alterirhizorhabdus profundi TaxID=2681549 RepID=UPI0012E7E8BF|nr:hypothetical protein [Sphingomonas profundi]